MSLKLRQMCAVRADDEIADGIDSRMLYRQTEAFWERETSGVVTFSLNCPNCPPPPEFAYVSYVTRKYIYFVLYVSSMQLSLDNVHVFSSFLDVKKLEITVAVPQWQLHCQCQWQWRLPADTRFSGGLLSVLN